jgi:hypothetical protein
MSICLTVGMATHNDFQGVYFTIQALQLYHPEVLGEIEILVVDNDPAGQEGRWTKDFVANWVMANAGKTGHPAKVTYIEAPEVEGTSAPRDLVFRRAAGKYVLCVDCHVMLYPGALESLLGYYVRNPNTLDIISGPIFMDNLSSYGTHFDDVWRGQMWGVWACAWRCPCGFLFCPREVSRPNGAPPGILYFPIMSSKQDVVVCPICSKHIWVTDRWWGHETPLWGMGFYPAGKHASDSPFEIPAMGLGLFSMRKEAWPGFNPLFRGFGGEEGYIHEKVRRAGGKAICLPALRWVHRFTREGQTVPYPLNLWNKVRNHVLGHLELGLPLDRLREEFIGRCNFPEDQWQQILDGAEWPAGHDRYTPHQFAREKEQQKRQEGQKGRETLVLNTAIEVGAHRG